MKTNKKGFTYGQLIIVIMFVAFSLTLLYVEIFEKNLINFLGNNAHYNFKTPSTWYK